MAGEYITGIQCEIQNLIKYTIMIESSLNKKCI